MTKDQDIILGVWLGLWLLLLGLYLWSNYQRNVFFRQVLQEMEIHRNRQNGYLFYEDEIDKIPISV